MRGEAEEQAEGGGGATRGGGAMRGEGTGMEVAAQREMETATDGRQWHEENEAVMHVPA